MGKSSSKFRGGKIEIGKYCSIASGVVRLGANHPTEKISMHPFFYNPSLGFTVKDVERKSLNIGNGVWIGFNSLILPGCTSIGNGAVIGAGSIVTHDVEPYSIVAGNPARVIKMRFSQNDIDIIEQLHWWDWTPQELMRYYDSFDDIPRFFEEYNNGL